MKKAYWRSKSVFVEMQGRIGGGRFTNKEKEVKETPFNLIATLICM